MCQDYKPPVDSLTTIEETLVRVEFDPDGVFFAYTTLLDNCYYHSLSGELRRVVSSAFSLGANEPDFREMDVMAVTLSGTPRYTRTSIGVSSDTETAMGIDASRFHKTIAEIIRECQLFLRPESILYEDVNGVEYTTYYFSGMSHKAKSKYFFDHLQALESIILQSLYRQMLPFLIRTGLRFTGIGLCVPDSEAYKRHFRLVFSRVFTTDDAPWQPPAEDITL